MWILVIVLFVFISILILVSHHLTTVVVSPPMKSIESAMAQEIEQGFIQSGYYESLKKEDFSLKTKEGHHLVCQLIENPIATEKYIVFCHGYGFNRVGSIKYLDIFLKEGFNIVLYDHRNSGQSQGNYTTMGYFEKEDLKIVIDYLYQRFGQNILVGTHGESMGAATVLLHCAEDRRAQFVIADCPYSDLKDQLAYRLKIEHKLPRFPFLKLASGLSKIRAGFFFGSVSPIKVIQENDGLKETPIMFVHGDADSYIPLEMTKDMYQVKKGPKRLYIAKGAEHAISVCVDRNKYAHEVHGFLEDTIEWIESENI